MRMTLLVLVVLGVTFSTVQSDTSPRIVCYFASGAVSRPGKGRYGIEDIPVDQCTHIIYSFIGVTDGTNEVLVLNPKVDEEQNGFRNFTSLRSKYPGTKFVVALGGWDEGGSKYSVMASHNSSRSHFIQSIVNFLEEYQFDGLDLNWQFPGAENRNGTAADKDNFLHLVYELKEAFTKAEKNWELTAAVPLTEEKITAGYRVSELCRVLDAIHVMSYDLRSVWYSEADELNDHSDTSSSFKKINVDGGLSLWEEKGCPRQKLVVGIPFYGKSFTLTGGDIKYDVGTKINQVAGDGNPGPYTKEKGFLAYYEICSELGKRKSKWTKKWDKHGKCPYAYKKKQWISYDDPKSIKIKISSIKEKGYLGAVTWSIDMDDFQGFCGKKNPLISLINKQMKTYTVPILTNGTTTTDMPQTDGDSLHLTIRKTKEREKMQVTEHVESQLNDTVLDEIIPTSSAVTPTRVLAAVAKQDTKLVWESEAEDQVLNTTIPTSTASPIRRLASVAKKETKRDESQLEDPFINTTVPTSSATSPIRLLTAVAKDKSKLVWESQLEDPVLNTTMPTTTASPILLPASVAKKETKQVESQLDDTAVKANVSISSSPSPILPIAFVAKQDSIQPHNNVRSHAISTTKTKYLNLFAVNIILILYTSMLWK